MDGIDPAPNNRGLLMKRSIMPLLMIFIVFAACCNKEWLGGWSYRTKIYVTSVHPETGIFAGKVVFASNLQGARHASFVKISSKVARIHDE